jgi:hypothetical protein
MIVVLTTAVAGTAMADADTWRVAYGGGRITGYVGMLASHGMPREFLCDEQLADPARLAEYRVVIVSAGGSNVQRISRAIADYVAAGGIAITEEHIAPSTRVVPGERLGPARAANMIFTGYDHPISKSMHSAGIVTTHTQPGIAIIPKDAPHVTVLAAYTDERVPERHRGELTGGRKNLPAALLIEHGEGQWLHFGTRVGFSLALRGFEMQPVMLEALRLLTDGMVVPRFADVSADRRLVAQARWEPEPRQSLPRRVAREEEPADPPAGFEAFDLPDDTPADYVLTGTLDGGAEAEIMLPWFSETSHQRLEIGAKSLRLTELRGGRERVVAEAPRPGSGPGAQVDVRRRPDSVTLFIDRRVALIAPLTSTVGLPATRGLDDAFLQPAAPVVFSDDFMRVKGDPSPWNELHGSWQLFEVEGEAEQGANPFAYQAEAGDDSALATAGHWFWDDYDISCAVRPDAWTVALLGHFQAEDDHVQLRMRIPDEGDAAVQLVRVLPEGERVLATASVDAARGSWQQLRLRLSGGHALVSVGGQDLFHVADDLLHGSGEVGLRVAGGDAFFDDVYVRPWEALPVLDAGETIWAVERGRLRTEGGRITLDPSGMLRAVAPIGDLTDLEASATIQRRGASWAGMLLRYQGPRDHYLLGLLEEGGESRLELIRNRRGDQETLAAVPVGGRADAAHDLRARLRGRQITVWLDGERVIDTSDDALAEGSFAIAAEGGVAEVRGVTCWPIDHERSRVDPETPPHAGDHRPAHMGGSRQRLDARARRSRPLLASRALRRRCGGAAGRPPDVFGRGRRKPDGR